MTNEEMIEDIKQYFEVTIRREVGNLEERMDAGFDNLGSRLDRVESRLNRVESRLNRVEEGLRVADAKLDTIHDAVAETAEDHEHRIHRLEKRAA